MAGLEAELRIRLLGVLYDLAEVEMLLQLVSSGVERGLLDDMICQMLQVGTTR